MRTPHTATHRGKQVKILLRNGEILIDKFVERKSTFIYLEKYGCIRRCDIRSLANLRG